MQLEQEFLKLCEGLASRPDVVYTQVENEKHMTVFSLYFRAIKVQLVYSRKWETVAPPSVLYCRFFLSKNEPLYLHLPELLGFLGIPDYRACYFPYIESPQRLRDCLQALMGIVDDYIPVAERLGEAGEDSRLMERWATEDFFEVPKAEPGTSDAPIDWDALLFVRKLQESFLVARHTVLDAYEAFLNGDREKALDKYKKLEKNGISLYEKGLCAFLRSPESKGFLPMPPQCSASKTYKRSANGDLTDLKGLGLLYLGFAAFFCGMLAAVNGVLAKDTLYFCGVAWWFGLILAVMPALFGYFAFQRRLRVLLGGSVDFLDAARSTRFAARLAAVVFAVVMVGCMWFCIAVPGMSSRYYDSYAIYYSEEETTERFEYAQVEKVCYISARYNVYGDRVERASYVLILKDGRQIDLDCEGPVEQQLAMVQHLFPGMEIETLDSDRDLP